MNRPLDSLSPLILLLSLSTACFDVENELAIDGDGDGQTEFEGDCDDTDPSLRSDTLWARDADLDGFGDADEVQKVCLAPGDDWVIDDTTDCDDSDPLTFPGAGELDSETLCMSDGDEDGWGDAEPTEGVEAGTDCDDTDGTLNQDDADADGYSSCDGDCDDADALQSVEDLDGDGYSSCGSKTQIDCDDDDADTFPGAAQNEAPPTLCMTDVDDDGWGDTEPAEGVEVGTDCDDTDETLNQDDVDSDNFSTCDEDCNDTAGDTFPGAAANDDADACMTDADGDGWGSTEPDEGAEAGTDCEDSKDYIYPGAAELDSETACMSDADDDGYGQTDTLTGVDSGSDCDDTDADVHVDAAEVCDEIDNDCDDDIDSDDADLTDGVSYYIDSDGDGFGDADESIDRCEQPSGYVVHATDCDDSDEDISPDATEICDEIDNDCDGDIDDADASLDLSTASTWYADHDGDGFGDSETWEESCEASSSGVTDNDSDCDDSDDSVHPDADEVCDGMDNDCDEDVDDDDSDVVLTTWYRDVDGDGYGGTIGSTESCDMPSGYSATNDDCDDIDSTLNNDDLDGDGYSTCDDDCDDEEAQVYLLATETCDGIDNDCDGDVDDDDSDVVLTTWYRDVDGDGYGGTIGSTESCDMPSGYSATDDDCDDLDSTLNQDDVDGDGYSTCDDDCDDADASVADDFGAVEECPGTDCLEILDEGYSVGDGEYWIDPDETGAYEAYCDMTTDDGGWTAFYAGTNGDTFANFEDNSVTCSSPSSRCLRPIPGVVDTDYSLAVRCGSTMFSTPMISDLIDYFYDGTQAYWVSFSSTDVIDGSLGSSSSIDALFTGISGPSNPGWMVGLSGGGNTFASAYLDPAYDYCNGTPDTTSDVYLFYR